MITTAALGHSRGLLRFQMAAEITRISYIDKTARSEQVVNDQQHVHKGPGVIDLINLLNEQIPKVTAPPFEANQCPAQQQATRGNLSLSSSLHLNYGVDGL